MAAAVLATLLLLGAFQVCGQLSPLGPVQHVLANRPRVTPTTTFDGPDFALVIAQQGLLAPVIEHAPLLRPARALPAWQAPFSSHIRPPPLA